MHPDDVQWANNDGRNSHGSNFNQKKNYTKMYNNQPMQQNSRTNSRTGEVEVLKSATAVVDKKSGDVLPIYKTYFEIGGSLYKVEVSTRKSETKNGLPAMWVKMTKKKKQTMQSNQRF